MAMVNGKIVGAKAKKIKDSLKKSKKTEKLSEKDAELKRPKEKKAKKEDKPVKAKKKTRVETSEPELFRIQIGPHGFLSVDLANDDAGNRVVEVRKWYNNDSEIKPGRGGFKMQAKSADLKLLAARLKAIAIELDAEG